MVRQLRGLLLLLISSVAAALRHSSAWISLSPPVQGRGVEMVEGHGVHRVAAAHRRLLLGQKFRASSPNGRFAEGAKAIDGRYLSRIEAHGKNLFYFFDRQKLPGGRDEASTITVHIHFGMSGAFYVSRFPPGREATSTTRLVLVSEEAKVQASLSAMTCVHGSLDLYSEKSAALGPDPLREDADKERLWAVMQGTDKAIGQILMDQSAVAGIGNIFRAEILYKAGVHPEQPSRTISREVFESLWMHSVLCLQRGFKTGSILTVDPEDAKVLGPPWTRRYVYNHHSCGRCRSPIKTWKMVGRTVYCCEVCQPLLPGTPLGEARMKAMKASVTTKVFVSHCASEGPETLTPAKMTVNALQTELRAKGLSTSGRKAVLVARLEAAGATPPPSVAAASSSHTPISSPSTLPPASAAVLPVVTPGTGHLGTPASAREAALEKELAGENRAVEHIALRQDTQEEEDSQHNRRRTRTTTKEDRARTWAAEVAVPGTKGLMDEALEAELVVEVMAPEDEAQPAKKVKSS